MPKYSIISMIIIVFLSQYSYAEEKAADTSQGYFKYVNSNENIIINQDATYTDNIQYSIKIINKEAIDYLRNMPIRYSASLSDIKIISAYTLKSDGKRIDVSEKNFQVNSNTGENGASPLISDVKTKTIIFPDVEIGDTIFISYQYIQKEALFPHQFSKDWVFSDTYICEDCNITVSAPDSLPIKVETRDIKGGEIEKKVNIRNWSWHYENHKIVKPDATATNIFDYAPRIVISTFKDYAELAEAYNVRAKPKAQVTERIKKLADEITKNSKNEKETAKSLYDWVAKNIHYLANDVGVGGVVPHDTDHILDNKIGDCKDHVTLLQALLSAKNIKSVPALINATNIYTISDIPASGIFNHVINYIPSLNLYVDSTSMEIPFGRLYMIEEGKPVIHTEDFSKIEHTPATNNKLQFDKTIANVSFNEDGSADGEIKTISGGEFAIKPRLYFREFKASNFKKEFLEKVLSSSKLNGKLEYVEFDDTDNKSDTYGYKVKFHIENAMNIPGPSGVFVNSVMPNHSAEITNLLNYSDAEGLPKHNFSCAGGSENIDITFNFPKSLQIIAIPKDVKIDSAPYKYEASYKREDNKVIAHREIIDNTAGDFCTPDMFGDKNFAVKVLKDLKSQIIFQ